MLLSFFVKNREYDLLNEKFKFFEKRIAERVNPSLLNINLYDFEPPNMYRLSYEFIHGETKIKINDEYLHYEDVIILINNIEESKNFNLFGVENIDNSSNISLEVSFSENKVHFEYINNDINFTFVAERKIILEKFLNLKNKIFN